MMIALWILLGIYGSVHLAFSYVLLALFLNGGYGGRPPQFGDDSKKILVATLSILFIPAWIIFGGIFHWISGKLK